MLVVAALGGNALLRRGEPMDAATMERNVIRAVKALAPIADKHQLVITHGNGPQIGLLALQSEAHSKGATYQLDVLGAETEGMIGYLIAREMHNQLPHKKIATLLTQTVVHSSGPEYQNPSKFIGPIYSQDQAREIHLERGWKFKLDGNHYRRVVPSPEPCRIMEMPVIQELVSNSVIVICAGGGGIPVTIDHQGNLCGVDAVVDKDLASAWLAIELQADIFLMLTDVDGVYEHWGEADQRLIRRTTIAELEKDTFAAGSMGPKIEAACRFASSGGTLAAIGALDDASKLIDCEAGTCIRLQH
jgi:carbamate kinase